MLHFYEKVEYNGIKRERNNYSSYFSLCTSSEIRTLDPLIKSQLLYQLS